MNLRKTVCICKEVEWWSTRGRHHGYRFFWKTSNAVLVRTQAHPGAGPRLAILCRSWNSLLGAASLLQNYFTAFQGKKWKMTSHITEIVGELLEDKM